MIGALLKHEIENTFQVVTAKSTNDELCIVCPECDDKSGHRSINLKTGKTFCWKCGKGRNNKGYFLAWARALGYQFASDDGQSSVPVERVLYREEASEAVVPLVEEVKLPAGFTPIASKPKSVYTKLIIKMARRKNLDYEDFAEAKVGFTRDDPKWEPFAIFPVYEYDLPVYYQGRTYIDEPDKPTKRFPSRHAVRWSAAYWVYNIDAVRSVQPEIVVVVESILNVLSLRWKLRELGWKSVVPVCVFKHHISKVQALKLIRCKGIKEICMLYDHDAIDSMWQSVGYLGNRLNVTIAEMPMKDGNTKLDANDDVEAAIDAIEQRKLYTNPLGRVISREKGIASREVDLTQRNIGS